MRKKDPHADHEYAIKDETDDAVIQAVFIGRDLKGKDIAAAGNVQQKSSLVKLLGARR